LSEPIYQTVPVTCPNCQFRFVAPVLTIVDVGQNPDLKALLLSGQINIAACPQCGNAGMLRTPLVYHDPNKELFLTYLPTELGLPEPEQQRIIGDLTNRLMSALPPEKRKGYLLRPQSFMRLEAMIEAILEADGITREMLEAQRAKAALLERLLTTASEDTRRIIAQANNAQIDYEFFQLLTLNIEMAESQRQEEAANQLLELRQQLLDWTTLGQEVAAREQAIESLGEEITREGLLARLVEAALAGEQTKVETMVTIGRPAIDYLFYQQLTARIDEAQRDGKAQEVQALKALRETILELTARLDAEVREATQQIGELLQQIVRSEDVEAAVRAHLGQIDELFLSVWASSLQAAEESGQSEYAEKLRQIGDVLMQMIDEKQPPQVRFINRLLASDYPHGTQVLLEENRPAVDAQLLEMMRLVGEDLDRSGRQEIARRLDQIRTQATLLMGGSEPG
jgi:hypothetical protein